jgi:hypothetical protein
MESLAGKNVKQKECHAAHHARKMRRFRPVSDWFLREIPKAETKDAAATKSGLSGATISPAADSPRESGRESSFHNIRNLIR